MNSDGKSYRWETICEPGAYVDTNTGDLFRVPAAALRPRYAPVIIKESLTATSLRKLSSDPFIPAAEARTLCTNCNIKPNF
jgi:hypothetical protein